jgi:hypothetical protein
MDHITKEQYTEFRDFAINNITSLQKSYKVACYYCYELFDVNLITNYEMDTGFCPYCNVDALLGDSTELPIDNIMFLKHMHFYGYDHIYLGNTLTVKKHHAAISCEKCMFINYLEHIHQIIPSFHIKIKELKSLGGPCPWQWEGFTIDDKKIYIRERCGILRIDLDDIVFLLLKDVDINDSNDLIKLTEKYIDFNETI